MLWWNLCDGWPQFSDAVVDYFYRKKLAFHYIKNSQKNVCIMLCEPEDGKQEIMLVNDTAVDVNISYKIYDVDSNEVLSQGNATVTANQNASIGNIDYISGTQKFYVIEWSGDASGKNHYLAGEPMFDKDKYVAWMEKSGLFAEWIEEISKW